MTWFESILEGHTVPCVCTGSRSQVHKGKNTGRLPIQGVGASLPLLGVASSFPGLHDVPISRETHQHAVSKLRIQIPHQRYFSSGRRFTDRRRLHYGPRAAGFFPREFAFAGNGHTMATATTVADYSAFPFMSQCLCTAYALRQIRSCSHWPAPAWPTYFAYISADGDSLYDGFPVDPSCPLSPPSPLVHTPALLDHILVCIYEALALSCGCLLILCHFSGHGRHGSFLGDHMAWMCRSRLRSIRYRSGLPSVVRNRSPGCGSPGPRLQVANPILGTTINNRAEALCLHDLVCTKHFS